MNDVVLSHYRILEPLASGGMGVVYLACDEKLERQVAIKVLKPETLGDDAARARFRDEALALSRLSHPGIATVHEFDHEDGADYLVMEYVPGDTLARRIEAGPLDEATVVELGAQIADALAAAHARGIVHRDLKPANVVVTPEGRTKVLDFGLAKLTAAGAASRSETAPLSAAGTLAYMAPEQVTGAPVSAATDLHALGVMLYEMATGARPHRGDSVSALAYAIAHRAPAPPRTLRPGLSEAFEAIVLQALEKEPARRPAGAAEFARALRAGSAPPRPPVVPGRIESLLVLPFLNLSGDANQEFFADGMTEALIASLAGLERLRVISRTTAMRYKGSSEPVPGIARALGVQAVIEGSVQRAAQRVRVGVQLIDALADRLLWARQYESEAGDVLALQADVARSVASEIRVQLTPHEAARLAGPGAVDPRAYEAYLHGRFHWNRRGDQDLRRGAGFFEQALAIDPHYALAWVGLGDSYNLLGDMNAMPPREASVRAQEAVARALELDPELGEAHTSRAFLHMFADWNWAAARRAFERAIELSPGYATGHQWYAEFLAARGEFERAIAEAHRARDLDPLAPIMGTTVGDVNFFARRYDEALAWLRQTVALDPGFYHALNDIGRVLSEVGRYDEALASFEQARRVSDSNPLASVGAAYTLARAGRADEARRIQRHLLAESEIRYVSPHALASIHLGLGELEPAIGMIERAYREQDRALVWIAVHPRLDPLRGNPRFERVVAQVMAT